MKKPLLLILSIAGFNLFVPLSARASTPINTCVDLVNIQRNLNGQYILMKDIDCNGYIFTPIGSLNTPFTGTLDGNNHIISHLNISLKYTDYVGLFGVTNGATISNLQIANPTVWGQSFVGSLIGMGQNTTINSVVVSGNSAASQPGKDITGTSGKNAQGNPHESLGGLAGALMNSTVNNSSSSSMNVARVDTTGSNSTYYYVGGLIGKIENTTITKSHSSSMPTVGGTYSVGGLIGKMVNSIVKQSYSFRNVINPVTCNGSDNTTVYNLGGLIGEMDNTTGAQSLVTTSYAASVVSSGTTGPVKNSGGLIGYINSSAKNCDDLNSSRVENSFASGSVYGATNIGGLIGQIAGSATLQNNYSVGGPLYSTQYYPVPMGVGGLVGTVPYPSPPVCAISSYWNTDTEKGVGTGSNAGTGKTTQEMYKQTTYVNWDFVNIWNIKSNNYPCLRGVSC